MFDASLAAAVHRAADASAQSAVGHIRQTEILSDMFAGHFDAVTTVGEAFAQILQSHDGISVSRDGLGLGVAEAADGEIVAFDGQVWRVPADGRPVLAEPTLGLPFAVVAAGGEPVTQQLPPGLGFAEISAHIDTLLRRLDTHHDLRVAAVRIDGLFGDVLLRSEPRQTRPYPTLSTVLEHEASFEFSCWPGTLVGFRFPDVNDGIVIPGLHLHGVSDDRASGGHCHHATIIAATLSVWVDDVEVRIPSVAAGDDVEASRGEVGLR